MGLQVWLPLNGDLHNQGLKQIKVINNNTTFDSNGKIGQCCNIASGQYLGIDAANVNNNKYPYISIACWIYPTQSDSTERHVICCYESGGCGINLKNTKFGGQIYAGGYKSCYTPNTISLNTWYHVCMTYNGSKLCLYLNGEEVASVAASGPITYHNTCPWQIAGNPGATSFGSNNFIGKINDLRIYDHALSAKEVEEIAKGLVLHYKLDQPNDNILTQEILHTAPFASATTFVGDYEGYNDVISVRNNTLYQKTSSGKNDIFTGITWNGNVQYTLSGIWRDDRTDGKNSSMQFRFHYTDNTTTTIKSPQSKWGQWIPFKLTSTAGKSVDKITTTYGNAGDIYIANFKLEIGPDQTLFLGFTSNNIIYDSSGYNNDGTIIGSLEATTSSSRYSCATKFSNSSVIKVIENNWLSQGMKEMTINVWAKASTWPTTGRLFSCTETGGFNLEAGSSGYWRFSVHVYTNSAQSSTAYKYDNQEIQISALPVNEWVMITLIYDGTGTRSYINGELHHTYSNVSYGIHFNTNARLFLGCEASTANPSSPYFTGQMSDFRIYNTVLTAEQIKELYNTSMTIDNNGNIHARELVE